MSVSTMAAGSILKFRVSVFLFVLCSVASQLRPNLVVDSGGIQTVDAEFLYRVPIVDRGTIAVPLFADPVSDSSQRAQRLKKFKIFAPGLKLSSDQSQIETFNRD